MIKVKCDNDNCENNLVGICMLRELHIGFDREVTSYDHTYCKDEDVK